MQFDQNNYAWCDTCQSRQNLKMDRSGELVCGHSVARARFDMAEAGEGPDGRRVVGVRCVYCHFEKIETTKEVAEMRIYEHLKKAHGIVLDYDHHVA